MSGRRVVGVAGHVGLLSVGPPECDLPFGDDTPVLTRAAVVRQPDEERGRVDILLEGFERHRIAAERRVPSLDLFPLDGYRRADLAGAGHGVLLT
jgi:hypothetical protein